ncbi:MAG TPA: glycosyltransferase [Vicinamibacterales bacterium]|nr:glycosyltransferase [Vicinamibacterales bacterium]
MRPLVSFVIPVKNDAARLRRCLESILNNDHPRELIEMIVIDNGSTDGSGRVARECGAVVLQCSQGSVAELRNRGARAALGTILAFVDADHEIDPHWISTAIEVLSTPNVVATGAPYIAEPSANWVQQQYDGLRDRPATREDVTWLGSGNLAVVRAAFQSIGGFNADLTACEDVDFCNRLIARGYRIVADPALRSVHFGDPRTLKALFFGELWRGRDNIRVTVRGPRTFRNFRSALIPAGQLLALTGCIIALAMGWRWPAVAALLVALAPAAARAAMILRRKLRPTISGAAQAFAVAVVFDAARALALVARATHQTRRSA